MAKGRKTRGQGGGGKKEKGKEMKRGEVALPCPLGVKQVR